ncbi:hypothetical protein [Ectobacillus panaciterrae]|uniref:hypothetical protein n=1 Tax=Ectobacillus panaciterrae TaxID=363872 RepID=UPI0003FED348|nr:hypothetical protein [Ectobacillus panaciterrae]
MSSNKKYRQKYMPYTTKKNGYTYESDDIHCSSQEFKKHFPELCGNQDNNAKLQNSNSLQNMNTAKPLNSLSDPVNVDITGFVPNSQNEPSVAQVNANTILVAANDFRSGSAQIGLYRSTDGGFSWDTSTTLPNPEGFQFNGDPYVRVIDNTAIVSGGAFNVSNGVNTQGTIVSYVSSDSGSSFSGPFVVTFGSSEIHNDKPYLAIDKSDFSSFRGMAYISYTQITGGSNTILFQRSFDGKFWDPPKLLSIPGHIATGSSVAVGPRGQVYVGWIDFTSNTFEVAISFDGGATFPSDFRTRVSSITPLTGGPLPPFKFNAKTFAFLATDISTGPNSGTVYAVWMDNGSGSAQIMLSSSTTSGLIWSLPGPINDSPFGTQNFFPAIAVSPSDGTVSVVYYTNRVTSTLIDVFIATLTPGGASFTNSRLSNDSFDPQAFNTIGDYIDIDTGGSVAVWTGIPTNKEDIFIGFGLIPPSSNG